MIPESSHPELVALPESNHKDRLIDVLQAQLQKVREELSSSQYALSIIKAKLEEARRALDRCMGIRL